MNEIVEYPFRSLEAESEVTRGIRIGLQQAQQYVESAAKSAFINGEDDKAQSLRQAYNELEHLIENQTVEADAAWERLQAAKRELKK